MTEYYHGHFHPVTPLQPHVGLAPPYPQQQNYYGNQNNVPTSPIMIPTNLHPTSALYPPRSPYQGSVSPSYYQRPVSPSYQQRSQSPFQPPSPLVNAPSPILPNSNLYVTYVPQVQQVMNMRTVPGLPVQVPEIPSQDLVSYKTAEKMFREVIRTHGQYSCWPIHDLYSWYLLCEKGLHKPTNHQDIQWNLGRKGIPPVQHEGFRQWVEKSQRYQGQSKDFFQYQFRMSMHVFWLYKNHAMHSPAYTASAFVNE